jgi:hypothetical protein
LKIRAKATKPQTELVNSTAPFPAMVAGYGAGKSHALILRTMKLIFGNGGNIAYYLPTYDLIKTIAYPRFIEVLDNLKVAYKLNKSDHILEVNNKQIIFRTLDNPDRIVGYEVTDSMVDELDTLPINKARECWVKIIARNRQKKVGQNTVAVGTTPEGFRFVYEQWGKNPTESYQIIKAPTYSNPHLPENYIDLLRETYPPQLLEAYIEGEFVNLTSGSVYPDYDRELNGTDATIQKGEPLHIGMDFNVNNGAAVVHIQRSPLALAVDELTGVRDTPSMIKILQEKYTGHTIIIYPDASGGATKSVNASISDLRLLKDAGFTIDAPKKNPFVKDRVAAFNRLICNPAGDRYYRVNTDKCPNLAVSLEQQVYDKNGVPDKESGLDHIVDGAGYYVSKRYPIKFKKAINQPKRWS